jgi:hypothetical protein
MVMHDVLHMRRHDHLHEVAGVAVAVGPSTMTSSISLE